LYCKVYRIGETCQPARKPALRARLASRCWPTSRRIGLRDCLGCGRWESPGNPTHAELHSGRLQTVIRQITDGFPRGRPGAPVFRPWTHAVHGIVSGWVLSAAMRKFVSTLAPDRPEKLPPSSARRSKALPGSCSANPSAVLSGLIWLIVEMVELIGVNAAQNMLFMTKAREAAPVIPGR